jgi:hypothetical protein
MFAVLGVSIVSAWSRSCKPQLASSLVVGMGCEAIDDKDSKKVENDNGPRTRNADGESVCDAAGGCRGAAFFAGVLCAEEAFGG